MEKILGGIHISYIVCNMKKLKRTSVGNVERENERDQTYEAKNPKIDLSRTHDNYHIIALPQSYMECAERRYLHEHLCVEFGTRVL